MRKSIYLLAFFFPSPPPSFYPFVLTKHPSNLFFDLLQARFFINFQSVLSPFILFSFISTPTLLNCANLGVNHIIIIIIIKPDTSVVSGPFGALGQISTWRIGHFIDSLQPLSQLNIILLQCRLSLWSSTSICYSWIAALEKMVSYYISYYCHNWKPEIQGPKPMMD